MRDLVRVQVGRTDGYRYIGVQPPLNDEQMKALTNAAMCDPLIPARFSTEMPNTDGAYSEAQINVQGFVSPARAIDKGIVRIAWKLANVLETAGAAVVVDETIHQIDMGRNLFEAPAEQLA